MCSSPHALSSRRAPVAANPTWRKLDMTTRIRNLRFMSAALLAAGALALAVPSASAQSSGDSSSTTGKIESGASNAASDVGSAASSAASDVGSAASKAASMIKSNPNAEILSELHESNQAEIGMGKLALERATTPQVKSYGEMLIRDHSAADRKVTEIARNIGAQLSPMAAPSTEQKKETNHDAAVREMLEGKKGRDFDWNFLQAMKDDHEKDIQEMSEASNKATNEQVKSLVQEVMPTLKKHRDRADNLLSQIKSSGETGANGGAGASTNVSTR
jgi:putative membrane protein